MRRVVLLDGGMGQELIRRAGTAPDPLWSARAMMDRPELVRDVHLDNIRAGARVITLNTYSATPERLAREGVAEMFAPLQALAVRLAREARDRSGEDVRIAGCLSPAFGSYRPELSPPFEEALTLYRQSVAAQAEGVDLFLCETMGSAAEARAAASAAAESGRPVWVAWSLRDDGDARLRSGETLTEAGAALAGLRVAARLVNCCHPESIDAGWEELRALGGPVGAYANAFVSIAELEHGGTATTLAARGDLGPDAYAERAMRWVERGAAIVGGCCEIGPAHIARLAERLREAGFEISGELP